MTINLTLKNKLLAKTKPQGTCLLWTGCLNSDGYPRISYQGNCNTKAHRLMYEASTGEDITGKVVRHTCDNPVCINPEHLLSGTPTQNMEDRDSRGRHGAAKISIKDVRDIRQMFADNPKLKSPIVAKQYSISPKTVLSIKHRSHWKHV